MSRLAPLDRALLLILVPLWMLWFGLGVRTQILGGGVAGLGFSVEDAHHYPRLSGQFSRLTHAANPLAEAGLREGDRLIQLGDVDLRGVGTLGFAALSTEVAGRALRVPVIFERDGTRRATLLPLAPVSVFGPMLAASLGFAASALFLLLRARPTATVRAFFQYGMCQAIYPCTLLGSRVEFYAWYCMFVVGCALVHPLMFRLAFLFPAEPAPSGWWHRAWPWLFGVANATTVLLYFTSRIDVAELAFVIIAAVAFAALLFVVTANYLRADRIARRQMKWVLFGAYCAVLPIGAAAALGAVDPRLGWLWFASQWAALSFPAFFVVSVLRFNLFDVDRILSATASYNLLLVLLGAGALVVVPHLAEALSGTLGIDPGAGQILLSLALVAAVIPAHRRLRPQIDRVFFKERFALDAGIAELLPTLSSCSDARDLTERAGAGLHRLLQPEACVVYAAAGGSFAPVFVKGRAVPPAFEAGSPLVASLGGRRAPLSLSDAGRRPDQAPLGPFDRAALETLQAEVVVPIRQDDALAAFLCLGPKRSGDVYTSTDLSLLTAVADTVARELRHLDQEETIRDAREMQEALRRYVPGAITEQLSSRGEISSGEREVSVLFVDIRGYVAFAESRRAEDIFSTVNRYTETVSQVVHKHAGNVVEFNGDGMMAVFGAPRELAHKERAAVEAAREIVDAVGALPVEGEETKLSVGVGIATGEAFVGNIQAVDRMIWSAIGNTTNLAARLQSLTRELDAAVVIDLATWKGARRAAEGFERRPAVPIRGRREAQDVYALPMQTDA